VGYHESGVVSCTGLGDGVYRLEVSKMDNLVHGIRVTFLATEMNKEDELQIQNQV